MKSDESDSEEDQRKMDLELDVCLDSHSAKRRSPVCKVYAGTKATSRGLKIQQVDDQVEQEMREILSVYEKEERGEARRQQEEILNVVESLGGDSAKYRRERARCARAIIAEIYSPPRVSELARQLPKYECAPGLALDLTVKDSNGEAWDFSLKRMRDKAEKMIETQRPSC